MVGETTVAATLSADQILVMLQAAVAKAQSMCASINVAIVDRGGATCGFVRMADAHLGGADVAVDKAWTCSSFGGLSTRAISEWISAQPSHIMAVLLGRPRCTPLTGGLAIRLGDIQMGAIGVSGASADQDEECCRAALEAVGAEPG